MKSTRKTARKTADRNAADRARKRWRKTAAAPYHHGSLHEAMLTAAERILERDGIAGLTLRAAAREAGVSHAAPKNHFGDIRGLVSELAAVGFARFATALTENVHESDPPRARLAAIGQGYVAFARQNPGLFLLMFRSERLDFSRPALRTAADAAFEVLSSAAGSPPRGPHERPLTLPQAARITAAWSLVHGFSMLMLDGRLNPLIAGMQDGTDAMALLAAILKNAGDHLR